VVNGLESTIKYKLARAAMARTGVQLRPKRRRKSATLLVLALPFLLLILAFSYVPLFGWIYAFFNYKPGIPLQRTPFVGLYFFRLLFQEGGVDFLRVLTNTFAMGLLGIAFTPLPVILALLLNEVRSTWFRRFIQTTTTLPNFVSWIIVYSLALTMFSSDGVLNSLLLRAGLISEPLSVLGNQSIVWIFQASLGAWKGIGWGAIIYLAAMSGIDQELYDAAKVDGAGRLARIIHVTLPGIAPTYVVLLLLQVSGILSAGGLDQYLVFFNPQVADRIETLDYYVYRLGVAHADFAYSTAIGIMKSGVSVALLFGVNELSRWIRGNRIV
jgi:putative aldouronate transport system permease protein